MGVSMMDDEGKLVEGSNFSVRTENINLMAISSENEGKNQNATGSVSITSKNVNIEAIDYEAKDGLFTEKELTHEPEEYRA